MRPSAAQEKSIERASVTPLLAVRDVSAVAGGRTILDVPHLEVRSGETLAVIGPNGSGKSTLLHVLAGLRPPDRGVLLFDDRPVARLGTLAYRRRLAVVMQEPLLLDTSVAGNVALGLRFRGVSGAEREARIGRWLDRLDVAHLRDRSIRHLSGGEAQRVSLARALATEPDLLFLDEPFAALDAPSHQSLLDTLFRILRDTGQTTVFVTHDRNDALALGDRVAVVFAGRIRQIDTPDVVFAQPADEDVATFVGVENVLPAEVCGYRDGLVDVVLGEMTVQVAADTPRAGPVWLALRPEDIVLWPETAAIPPSSARNVMRGEVTQLRSAGTNVRVTLASAGVELVVLITRRSAEEFGVRPGMPALATFKATAAHLLERSG